jgi:hypothetical protein
MRRKGRGMDDLTGVTVQAQLLGDLIDDVLLVRVRLARAGVEDGSYPLRTIDEFLLAVERCRIDYRRAAIELTNK